MAHPELDELLNTLLPFAQSMLAKHGEFFPFGATMTRNGEVVPTAASFGDEHPPSQAVVDLLTRLFREQAAAGMLRAAGLCFDARIVVPGQLKKSDAMCFSLEHETGQAVNVYVPYEKGWFGKVKYGDMIAEPRAQEFFGSASAT